MPAELLVRTAGFSPVKGMRHLARERVELDAHGPVGDRAWCVVDVRARRVLRTVQHPSLLAVLASADGDELTLTLPSGETVAAPPIVSAESVTCDYWGRPVELALTGGPHAALLSDHLARDVRLAAAPRGGVVFGSPVTVIGTASLRELAERVGEPVDSARFRANLVVETEEPWVEDSWTSTEVRVGTAVLRVGGQVPRCAVVDHHPETGVRDLRLLKALVASRPTNRAGEPMLGVYADVVQPGAAGDGGIRAGRAHTGVK
ncbi:MOSC domain-containing protein [Nocardioides hwasunensis]|uniref:MOSC domain-containing protein n=1 Tax=Nocardioides hwasunensis TaxID=397258 RepID=A0ABR8MIC4_9ACTN|nr:MOSC N-terminal beta barrel domain-containing protein [Nocardioides hwasunensis]MBD3915325.1 MOSC domain-containing protein [Nocardioides hwasunensis]